MSRSEQSQSHSSSPQIITSHEEIDIENNPNTQLVARKASGDPTYDDHRAAKRPCLGLDMGPCQHLHENHVESPVGVAAKKKNMLQGSSSGATQEEGCLNSSAEDVRISNESHEASIFKEAILNNTDEISETILTHHEKVNEETNCQSEPASSGPLSAADIRQFEEDGFVLLKQAFSSEVAAAGRDYLWRRVQAEGIMRDPSTWVARKGIAEIYGTPSSAKKRRGYPWKNAVSPRLRKAIDQLVGAGAWEEFGCGWWVITFPGFAEQPWRSEGKWHVDGAHFKHYPHSREIGVLPIFLFSDVLPHGGGTALLRGSHKRVAEIIWKCAGKNGIRGPAVSDAARKILLPASDEDVVETRGEAGDVMLTHPLLLHARSTNLAQVCEEGVRFMCHPAVPLKEHLNFKAPPESFSPVQRVIWHTRRGQNEEDGEDSLPAIYSPDECDHSPVKLPSW